MKLNIEIEITDEDIDEIMVNALEDGACCWCDEVEPVGYYHAEISKGGKLIFHNIENDCYWMLDKNKFLKGIKKYIANGWHGIVYNGKINCNEIDSRIANYIIQYALFDKIVFW